MRASDPQAAAIWRQVGLIAITVAVALGSLLVIVLWTHHSQDDATARLRGTVTDNRARIDQLEGELVQHGIPVPEPPTTTTTVARRSGQTTPTSPTTSTPPPPTSTTAPPPTTTTTTTRPLACVAGICIGGSP